MGVCGVCVWVCVGVVVMLTHCPMHMHRYRRVMLLYRVPAEERHGDDDMMMVFNGTQSIFQCWLAS